MDRGTYWGWHDPDKRKPVRQKVAEGCAYFAAKFGRAPRFCGVSGATAEAIAQSSLAHALPDVQIVATSWIPDSTFWFGNLPEQIR